MATPLSFFAPLRAKAAALAAPLILAAASASGQTLDLGPVRALAGDAAVAPAVKMQDRPSVAPGANGFLAVWQEQRTILQGQPNAPFETLLGNSQDIYAARLDATGKLIDPKPIVISNQAHVQGVPRVAWNGQHWLVAFLTVRPGDYYSEDLVAVRVAPDGTVVDPTPKVLRAQNGSNGISNLAVASDGSGWAVVWEDFNAAGVRGVEGIRVESDGSAGVARSLWYDTWNTYATDVAIAFSGDRFLVVWVRNSGELVGLRVTTSLARIDGAPVPISVSSAARPSVTGNGADFLVAWHDMINVNDAHAFAARVSRTGAVLDPAGIPLGTPQTYAYLAPEAAWNGFEYVVAFEQGSGSLYYQRVGTDGRKIDAAPVPLAPSALSQGHPALTSLGDGTAQLVYELGTDIAARRIAADGGVGGTVPVSVDRPRQSGARFASHASGHLAVFLSETAGQTRVLAQRVDAAGNPLDAEPRLVASGAEGSLVRPDVAWNGSVYQVVWQGPEGILGRRLAADGTPLGAAEVLLAGTNWSAPAVGALGSDFLVVALDFHKFSTVWQNWLQGIRVSGAGQVLDAPFVIRAGYELVPRVTALGGQWLVVWESQVSSKSSYSGIVGAFVSAAGAPGTPFAMHSSGSACAYGCGDDPDVAVQGDTALVTWFDNGAFNNAKIDARLLKADGTFATEEIEVVQASGDQVSPAVTGDGSGGWVVSWVDYRNTSAVAQLRGDIWAARLSAAGTVGGVKQVTTGPLPEEQPELAPIPGNPGAALLAYSALDPGNYRIVLRTVGATGVSEPPPPASAVASLTLNPASVVGSKTSTATVTLASPAPAAGAKVLLSSANVNVATVPASVLVAAGTTSKTFTVTSKPVASSSMVGITATYSGASKTAVLTVQPPAVSGLTLSPATFAGGCQGSTGKVTLSGKAPTGGLVVPLTNTNPVAVVPASVTVPAGATYVTFPITAPAVASIQTGVVSATFGGVTKSVTLKVRPIGLASLTLVPNPVVGPNAVIGTVTLECPAQGSVAVALSSSTVAVAKPAVASVTIPSGSTTATFTVTTADVSAVSYATIKAVAGGVTRTVKLTVNP